MPEDYVPWCRIGSAGARLTFTQALLASQDWQATASPWGSSDGGASPSSASHAASTSAKYFVDQADLAPDAQVRGVARSFSMASAT
jgi:hypothetical protein